MKKLSLAFLLLFIPIFATAQDNCPAVDCDCIRLPLTLWQNICETHEAKLKKSCVANNGKPMGFCRLHGPGAKPLPLAVQLEPVDIVAPDGIQAVMQQVAAVYWALRKDADDMKQQVDLGRHGNALKTFKLIDANTDNLFRLQRQVTDSWFAVDNIEKAQAAWADFAEDSEDAASRILGYGEQLWGMRQNTNDNGKRRSYKKLYLSILQTVGKMHEHIAYAYEGTEQHGRAATSWQRGAKLARALAEQKSLLGWDAKDAQKDRDQAAARWHRASYHWVLANQSGQAATSLNEADKAVKN